MNRQIVKLFALLAALFAVLVGFTSYWSVFDAQALKEKDANKRPLLEQQQIERGRILAADGTVIARSLAKGHDSGKRYVRHYPEGKLYGHPIGYSYVDQDSEFEQFHNDELVGNESEFVSLLDELRGVRQEGNDIATSIDPEAQRVALSGLEAIEAEGENGEGFGAVVAIEPSTGAVKVLVSNPPFDPNLIRFEDESERLNGQRHRTPLFDRATQGQYPPGSTFKVVTAAAGLDSGAITPETPIDAPGTLEVEGTPLENDFGQDFFGATLNTALTNSVNTWFGQLGQQLGNGTMFEYMERFGFNSTPPIDLPEDQVAVSGVFSEEEPLNRNDPVDLARMAIGQERLVVTPLQMAMVTAAIANGGSLLKPQIWSRVIDPDGRVVKSLDPAQYSQPISEETAAELTTAMEGVVSAGTGTNAAISGVPVAGKTGTAETPGNNACGGGEEENQAWFIGFAPADDPQIAIAATVECTERFGNDVAAPIFREVAETILNGG